MELWKVEQIGFGRDDLFEAIITAEEGTKLIAQVTIISVANDIVADHNSRITQRAADCFYCEENKPLANVVICQDCVDELTHSD